MSLHSLVVHCFVLFCFLIESIPLESCIIVCLHIHLSDILVALFGRFINEAAINICLRVFVLA